MKTNGPNGAGHGAETTGVVLPSDDALATAACGFPKTCACCKRSYGSFAFRLLELIGVSGFIKNGVKLQLEMRDCQCHNTISHLTWGRA